MMYVHSGYELPATLPGYAAEAALKELVRNWQDAAAQGEDFQRMLREDVNLVIAELLSWRATASISDTPPSDEEWMTGAPGSGLIAASCSLDILPNTTARQSVAQLGAPLEHGGGTCDVQSRCAVCQSAVSASAPDGGFIALAGYGFRLSLCETCASREGIEDSKEAAVVAYAREHPETKGGSVRGAEVFVTLPESLGQTSL